MALADLLQISYPIIQAPMLGVTTTSMVAAASNTGILGSLPVGGLSPERVAESIKDTRQQTNHTFAVNLFAHPPAPPLDEQELNKMQDFLAELCSEYCIPFNRQLPQSFHFYYYEDQIEVLLEENIPIVSFTFGQLSGAAISTLKSNGTTLIGTATSVTEAKLLADAGVDVICVQGIEAGGHRGTFLEGDFPQVGLMALLPQVAEQVNLPVIAAGGIADARTIQAAFAMGAAGVQVGSLFIVADESAASESYKNAVLSAQDTSTVLTRTFSGRWARGIQNEFMKKVSSSGLSIPYYTYQNALTSPIRLYAQQHGLQDFIAMWAGQAAGKATRATTAEIAKRLIMSLPNQ